MNQTLRIRKNNIDAKRQFCPASGNLARAGYYVSGTLQAYCKQCRHIVGLDDNSRLLDHCRGDGFESTELVRSLQG